MQPETKYARSGDVSIAYQVVGDRGPDLVLVPGWISHVEDMWEEASFGPPRSQLTAPLTERLREGRGERRRHGPEVAEPAPGRAGFDRVFRAI